MRADGPPPREPFVRIADRREGTYHRAAPRMRLDPLQLVAWAAGLLLVISGLIALARMGFENLALTDPVVEVADLPATPLLALILVLTGALFLTLATGEVDERALRLAGVLLGIVGVVWLVEPSAFRPYLGITARNGGAALMLGVVLAVSSFLPPLSIRRPGAPPESRLR